MRVRVLGVVMGWLWGADTDGTVLGHAYYSHAYYTMARTDGDYKVLILEDELQDAAHLVRGWGWG